MDDPNNKDSSSSSSLLSQPFLPKPSIITTYPTLEDQDSNQESDSNQQYLHITYNHGPRSFKDLPFLILFLLFVLSTFAFGIFSIFHRNNNYSTLNSYTYDTSTTSCINPSFSSNFFTNNFLSLSSPFVKDLIWTLVITLILSLPICWLLLLLLKHYTKHLVYASIPFFILIPIFLNVYWFVACTIKTSCSENFPMVYRILVLVFVFLVIGVIVWILVINWHRVELTVSIIGVASDALSWNMGLFGVLPCLTIGLVVYYVPIVVFLVFAKYNGKVVPKKLHSEYECVWKEDSWVPAYFALAILTMLWSAAAMLEAQVYVISGTIARWYFTKDFEAPTKSIRTSLRNAFGPSSGTICLSGLLIFVVRVVRSVVDNARQEAAPGLVNIVLRCCVNALLTAVDFLNKFTINFAAITGEAYCSSARMTYELLRRNLLSAVFVETISSRLLVGIVFVLSAIYTIVVCVILKAATNLGSDAYFVAAAAWLLLIIVLGFLVHVLDIVIDTIYVCYAIDRDRGEVCKQDVHEVYVHLPISRSLRQSNITRTLGV
ncbi:putative choline transporter [Medicago truncatula]|uniref:Choline transporter-like protein n=1 Tax=Medicago truncatula TaxID=3880 RepID=A0A072ULD0_MEDTR|nr:CTL-like protein DDB_G0274487 [Medicago truncatula]KEH30502.1 plasma-membrane choline transporter family protein [Medicago truncatula]RHN61494.1 putative choline transporter [Medicago truncatula]